MDFPSLITNLSAQLQLSDFKPDAKQRCALQFDDVLVDFYPDQAHHAFVMTSIVGMIDLQNEKALSYLLTGNILGAGAGGATISMDGYGRVIFVRRLALESLKFERLLHALELLVFHVRRWKSLLKAPQPSLPALDHFAYGHKA